MSVEITKEMTFGQLLDAAPQAGPVLAKYGLHCIGCHIAPVESIEQGCKAHGLDDAKIEELVNELKAMAQQ